MSGPQPITTDGGCESDLDRARDIRAPIRDVVAPAIAHQLATRWVRGRYSRDSTQAAPTISN